MALRIGCSRMGRLARIATAALISASTLCLASAQAQAHHYSRHRHYAHATHQAHYYSHYARATHYGRSTHYARRASPRYAPIGTSAVPSSPAFSAIVVDANSGRTLYSADENGLRHPASITKVMTLYLLFEKLESGAMTLQTPIPISQHAAAQEPSKLGLAPGDSISVDDAIKAVVTRSANDIAVAIAEAVGQSESNFADMMTRKAHELGMSNTLYRNASGLPNDEQVTTARDLTILGRSLEERFPRYFRYFSTAQFNFDGEIIGNHNHLLGRIDGVDGIKTGYTRASGFNLLTSVHRDGRSLLAVVMGGRSAAGRDRIMANLISDHIAEASTAHTATAVADASPVETAARATSRSWRLRRGRVRHLSPKPSLNASRPRRARRTRPGKATTGLATKRLRPRSRWFRRPRLRRARRSQQRPISACLRAPRAPSRQRKFRLGWRRRARLSCRRLDGPRLRPTTSSVPVARPSKMRTATVRARAGG